MGTEEAMTQVVQVTMGDALLDKINAMAAQEKNPDERKPNRSRTIRRLIRRGIEVEEKTR